MAKISLKGICSLSHQIIDKDGKVNIHNIEMNQDDFEDCVMLTIDEAKEILKDLNYLGYMTSSPTQETKAYNHSNMLLHRIEQAEGYLPIHGTPMEGKLILPKQAEGK